MFSSNLHTSLTSKPMSNVLQNPEKWKMCWLFFPVATAGHHQLKNKSKLRYGGSRPGRASLTILDLWQLGEPCREHTEHNLIMLGQREEEGLWDGVSAG